MKCDCGGELQTQDPAVSILRAAEIAVGLPRWSRNRRIRKKLRKRWFYEEFKPILNFGMARFIRRPIALECKDCGRITGFNQALANNIFQVQPMPLPAGVASYYSDLYDPKVLVPND